MKQFKEKPKMGKAKEKPTSARLPKQAVRMMKEKYIKELDQRPKGAEGDSGQQAPDQVEHAGRWVADELAGRATELGRNYAKRQFAASHGGMQAGPETVPSGEDPTAEGVPGGQAAPEYPTAASGGGRTGDPSPSAPKERPQMRNTAAAVKERQTLENRAATQGHSGPTQHSQRRPPRHRQAPSSSSTFHHSVRQPSGAEVGGTLPPGPAVGRMDRLSGALSTRANRLKERPRPALRGREADSALTSASGGKASRPSKALSPKIRRGILKSPVKPSVPNAGSGLRAAKAAHQKMRRQLFTRTKQTVKGTGKLIRLTVQAAAKTVAAAAGAVSAVVGGAVLLVALVVIIVIAAVASSPFGLFFAEEPTAPDAVSVSQAVGSVNMAYNAKLELLQAGDYDSIDIQGTAPDWPDVLAVFAVKVAGADAGGMDVATLDTDRVDKLTAVFWDMTEIASWVEVIPHEDSNPDDDVDDSWTERILHITIMPRTADDMRTAYSFTAYQNSALDELLTDRAALSALAGSLTITSADVLEVLRNLPDDLSPERRAVVEKVLSLVGKVNYFWGGKSYVIGWDSRWGKLMKVTSPGNVTSGTYRPFGLDCSGFLDWALRNAGLHSDGHWYIGRNLTAVSLAEAMPGDFALYPDASHVGMIVGRNAAGKLLVCHCSSGMNNVVVTEFAVSGFTAVGRQALVPR